MEPTEYEASDASGQTRCEECHAVDGAGSQLSTFVCTSCSQRHEMPEATSSGNERLEALPPIWGSLRIGKQRLIFTGKLLEAPRQAALDLHRQAA